MTEFEDFDLDRTTRRAWSRFQERLADHITEMADDDLLLVEVETPLDDDDGAAPYVQFCAWGEDMVRAEFSSNEYLAAAYALDDAATEQVVKLGWGSPTHRSDEQPGSGSANFFVDAERREADRLAAMTVAVLRDIFGVAHPAFLTSPDVETAESVTTERPSADTADSPDEPLAVAPESVEHLRALVEAAITPAGRPALAYDEDGDIPMPYGSALVYVRVHDTAPVVELFAWVVQGVDDVERAAFEVATLNRDNPLLKFVLIDDNVLARVNLPAMPFAPRHLRALLPMMAEVVDRVDDDLVARIGGQRGFEPDDDPETTPVDGDAEELHPALLTLLHLDPEGAGVEPDLAASVCDYDRQLVLQLLEQANSREHDWRSTVDTLRQALRVIVEREHARSTIQPSSVDRRAVRGPQQASLFGAGDVPGALGQDQLFDVEGDGP